MLKNLVGELCFCLAISLIINLVIGKTILTRKKIAISF